MSKCWIIPGMKLSVLKNRGPSITVIGAISQERGLVHYSILEESNNSDHFEHFLIGLKNKCRGQRVVIVLDNLRIHYAKKLMYIYDRDFKEMFLPTYSSELNPIERFWSILKRKWVQNLQLYCQELSHVRQSRSNDALIKRTTEKLHETIGKFLS